MQQEKTLAGERRPGYRQTAGTTVSRLSHQVCLDRRRPLSSLRAVPQQRHVEESSLTP